MTMSTYSETEIALIGVDTGEDVFHIIGFDHDGRIVLWQKTKRLSVKASLISCHVAWPAWRRA